MTTTPERLRTTVTIGGDLTVNRLGYGAMHLTGPGMWGPYPDPDHAVALLRQAVDLGVQFIDTADSYGPGDNERIIRQALHPYPDHLAICTKGGLLRRGPADWTDQDHIYITPLGRPAYLRQQVELSLRNLGTDRIDLYQLHSIDPAVPLAEQLGVLTELQGEGKIRHIGISGQPEITVDQLDHAQLRAEITAVENLYNVADRTSDPVIDRTGRYGQVFIPWFPLGHGTLTGPDSPLYALAAEYGATAPQLALSWLLHRAPHTLLIPGTTSPTHLTENMKAADLTLNRADLDHITTTLDNAGPTPWRPQPAGARA